MKKFIYEMAVYCGRTKVWRVLNINTGTVYSSEFGTIGEANASIEDGEPRAGLIVKRVTLNEVAQGLDNL